jgi:hypothetical protein
MCLQQQRQQKTNNQLTAKSCSVQSGNDSGRGNGSCGTCGGGNSVMSVAATTAALAAATAMAMVTVGQQ